MTELKPVEAVQSYLDTTDEVSAAGIIEHLEASGFVVGDREGWQPHKMARAFLVLSPKIGEDAANLVLALLADAGLKVINYEQ